MAGVRCALLSSTRWSVAARPRVLLAGGIGLLVAHGPLRGQPATTMRRIGWLSLGSALGCIEGYNLVVENRYARGNLEILRSYAEELVRLNVEIIGTFGNDATFAAKM